MDIEDEDETREKREARNQVLLLLVSCSLTILGRLTTSWAYSIYNRARLPGHTVSTA